MPAVDSRVMWCMALPPLLEEAYGYRRRTESLIKIAYRVHRVLLMPPPEEENVSRSLRGIGGGSLQP
jgi:hypothetical protein